MKTSARNQFSGTIGRVLAGTIYDEIEIEIVGGHRIVASVTRESGQELGLAAGVEASALVKASAIMLVIGAGEMRLSARNQLAGKVARVTPGIVDCEVVIDLPGGVTVAAVVTLSSLKTLGLVAGSEVTAVFKASSVIVAVPA